MNNNIVWKKFRIDELFLFNSTNKLNIPFKKFNASNIKDNKYSIAVVTQSEKQNGVSGYIQKMPEIESGILSSGFTYSVNFGLCFYHNYDFIFISTGGGMSQLIPKTDKLNKILNQSLALNIFFSKLITKVCRNGIFSYTWLPNTDRAGREYIMIPCIEIIKEDSIWEEEGKYYTLAVNYIESLMERAKERREENTIKKYEAERKKYEAERKKYEAERKKYEAEYLIEKPNVIWKKYSLSEVFNFTSFDLLDESLKQLNTSSVKDDINTIAVVTQSGRNNGVVGYVEPTANIVSKKVHNAYTFSNNFGICFYHNYDFVIPANNAISLIEPLTDNLQNILDGSIYTALFFSTIIHKICCKSVYNYMWKPSADRAKREYIELPCIECNKEESIWEEDNRYYTLPINYISYIYLSGRIKNCQRLIDNYTYKY